VTREIGSGCWNIGKKELMVFDAVWMEFDVNSEGQVLSLILEGHRNAADTQVAPEILYRLINIQ
jgi:Fe-S cluster assembly scaffold protein SufB